MNAGGDYMVKTARSIGFDPRGGRASVRSSPPNLSALTMQRMSWGLHVASSILVGGSHCAAVAQWKSSVSAPLVAALAVFPERGRLPCKEDVAGATPAGGSEANEREDYTRLSLGAERRSCLRTLCRLLLRSRAGEARLAHNQEVACASHACATFGSACLVIHKASATAALLGGRRAP